MKKKYNYRLSSTKRPGGQEKKRKKEEKLLHVSALALSQPISSFFTKEPTNQPVQTTNDSEEEDNPDECIDYHENDSIRLITQQQFGKYLRQISYSSFIIFSLMQLLSSC
jgi:hypothetical protein